MPDITPLARLNDPDEPQHHWPDIMAMFSPQLVEEMRTKFGLIGSHEVISHQLGKVLSRYQAAVCNANSPRSSFQKRELDKLKKTVDRTLSAFSEISSENRNSIDSAILYRDPFNRKFFFPEQVNYWEKNRDSTQLTINKLAQISHALSVVNVDHEREKQEPRRTTNTPLDHLIEDLTMDFERGTERKAYQCCYYDARRENYAGQYFEFVLFILDRFAPKCFHSRQALGKRIVRALRFQRTGEAKN